ncbi:complement C1q-like protein 4 isoform X1 [Biomphalaria glabrata]|uniref:Complement C1q-like protein 4 isoform X1 n=2 Tax=Biomphalaria glabrata TaxID=6526 RepID=A0A9W2YAL7_BIOGL|nr:complement C1q-like protein 4 isoform X1 [Biomphalaria glabrata]XP_055859735.1 complement C1q-like protein 4 isoform X1 [Biomphalaria glabrata]XP_055859736.1 complement C1q-like protein 4 isoform X1 [Biomphalaria glabrata]XP_055859737.1 complement C1q-like protein 4 isoform X1 [Biomphalaria glabrata]XP_055859738.1 complement C1q-like protein 4 isoform X1 [Biomphalaria glabrata]XP_055859739.1 complement C1q-like protein 4 isoform X1 [Biomphalaria glabrata]
MAVKFSNLLFVLLLLSLAMTSSKRAPRRNRNRAQMRDSQVADGTDDDVCELEVTCRSGKSLPVTLPIKGPRGPAGKPGSPGLPGKPGPAGMPGDSAGRDNDDSIRVAFYSGLTKNIGPFSKNTDLLLDRVVTNVGDAFNSETGRFTAPFNGTYAFAVTISAQGRSRAAVELVHNGKLVVTIWAESVPLWSTASNNAILTLEAGDQVWLVLLSRASSVHGYMYTTFSGHCLYRGL